MEIQLNAAPDDDDTPAASSTISPAVSMALLLSNDVDTPRDAIHSPLRFSSLNDSALSVESDTSTPKIPTLQTPKLQTLQNQLHRALEKLWGESAPAVKRQKKGKQSRRAKSAINNSADVYKTLEQLQCSISASSTPKALEDVIMISLSALELLDEKETIVEESEKGADVAAMLAKVSGKPVYMQLIRLLQRALTCIGDREVKELLTSVLNWSLARQKPEHWMWVLPVSAPLDSYLVHEFLVRQAIIKPDDVKWLIPILEFLTIKNPDQMVDIAQELLQECAKSSADRAVWMVQRLITLATESAVIVKACENSLQWIVTEELVTSLASKYDEAKKNSMTDVEWKRLDDLLLEFLLKRSAELSDSAFQLLLLLHKLTEAKNESLAASVALFHEQVVHFARLELSCEFVQGIYRYLPYISRTSLRLLQEMTTLEGTPDSCMADDEKVSKDAAFHHFKKWKEWLVLIAHRVSRKEVTEQLIKAELVRAEFEEVRLVYSFDKICDADRALCELLTTLLTPKPIEYVAFIRDILQQGKSASIKVQRRVLAIVQMLLTLNDTKFGNSAENEQNITLDDKKTSSIDKLARTMSWSLTLDAFNMWKGETGIEFYESFLDFACSKDFTVASRALLLVSRTPFLSLEDPKWQFRCVRKLSRVYFSQLRQYRVILVQEKDESSGDNKSQKNAIQSHLHSLKMVLFRVLVMEGGITHYSSSVYSIFASLWLDALLSTISATSVPTHFPNGVNFAHLSTNDEDELNERQIFRCERTISSKCTNLQSSQVITKNPDANLVYRKTLDSSWEREMRAARVCSVYATDLLAQLFASTGTPATILADNPSQVKMGLSPDEGALLERRLTIIVNMLLERVIPCCGITSDEIYKDLLPNRSTFDVDLRIEQWLNHFPAFLPLLRSIVTPAVVIGSSQLLRLIPIFKSALVVLIGHWNSVKGDLSGNNLDVPPYMRNANQLTLTCELIRLLRATNWLPTQLSKTAELLPLTTPADIRSILFSCWFYLSDHPPRSGSHAPTPATSAAASPISSGSSPAGFNITDVSLNGSSRSSHPPLEFYLVPLRKALHRNIRKIGAKYPLFMC
ncbi:putative integrator complex subunit 5 [Plasmopara halstedii]